MFWTELVEGKTGRFRCISPTSVDVHLRKLRKDMDAEDNVSKLLDMIEDWNALLEVRHKSCRYCGRP